MIQKVKSIKLKHLKNKLIIVKVGDADRPASPSDIEDMNKVMSKALKGVKCRLLITHHAVKIQAI